MTSQIFYYDDTVPRRGGSDMAEQRWYWGFQCEQCHVPLPMDETASPAIVTVEPVATWTISCHRCAHVGEYGPRSDTVVIVVVENRASR
jgi:hypothetical protein